MLPETKLRDRGNEKREQSCEKSRKATQARSVTFHVPIYPRFERVRSYFLLQKTTHCSMGLNTKTTNYTYRIWRKRHSHSPPKLFVSICWRGSIIREKKWTSWYYRELQSWSAEPCQLPACALCNWLTIWAAAAPHPQDCITCIVVRHFFRWGIRGDQRLEGQTYGRRRLFWNKTWIWSVCALFTVWTRLAVWKAATPYPRNHDVGVGFPSLSGED